MPPTIVPATIAAVGSPEEATAGAAAGADAWTDEPTGRPELVGIGETPVICPRGGGIDQGCTIGAIPDRSDAGIVYVGRVDGRLGRLGKTFVAAGGGM